MLLIISGINRANEGVIFYELSVSDSDIIDNDLTYKVIRVTEENKQDLLNFVYSVVNYNLEIDDKYSYLRINTKFINMNINAYNSHKTVYFNGGKKYWLDLID